MDVAGPRADGRLVLSTRGGLLLLRPGARPTAFAPGYAGASGEPYIALGSGRAIRAAGCSFRRDEVYALAPTATPGVVRIDRKGGTHRFASFTPGAFPAGIASDTVGLFGYRLLVVTTMSGKATLHALDCRGRDHVVTAAAPSLEGGLAVAPRGFGRFGGKLIAVDEGSGHIYAIGPAGGVRLVTESRLPAGGDIGVEAVGFVPSRLGLRGAAYLADLGSPGSPTSGSDALLVLRGRELAKAGLRAGELLVATEASAHTIAVRCSRTCTVRRVAEGPAATHAEGHIAFVRAR